MPENAVHAVKSENALAPVALLKNKVVILDFWGTWCSACIELFDKMEKLQSEFPDDLTVVLVNSSTTKDDRQKIAGVFKKREKRKGPLRLPFVSEDTVLEKYFPYRYLPHYAIIGKDGKVKAITSADQINSQLIRDLIIGKEISIRRKQDRFDFDRSKPLVIPDDVGDTVIAYRSQFLRYIEGFGTTAGTNLVGSNLVRSFKINYPLNYFILGAFDELRNRPGNRIILDSSLGKTFVNSFLNSDNYSSFYSYEIILPSSRIGEMSRYMREDIKRSFDIDVVTEKRMISAWVINGDKSIEKFRTKYKTLQADMDGSSGKKYIRYQNLTELLEWLDKFDTPMLGAGTYADVKIDIEFPDQLNIDNEKELISFLKKYGFDIRKETREFDVVAIKKASQ